MAKRYHSYNYDTFMVSGMHKLKDSLLVDDINCSSPFLLSVIIALCQGHYVYFTALIVTIHYSKRSVVDSRKLEGYCVSLRKTSVIMLL